MTTVQVRPLTEDTSLYRMYDGDGRLLYVGISMEPARRLAQHASDKQWWGEVKRVDIEGFGTRSAATDAEAAAIVTERPLWNVREQAADRQVDDLQITWDEARRRLVEAGQDRLALRALAEEAGERVTELVVAMLSAGVQRKEVVELSGMTQRRITQIQVTYGLVKKSSRRRGEISE